MNVARTDIPYAKWQTCGCTIKCNYIDEYVTIIVKNDWTSYCSWYKQYKNTTQESGKKIKLDKKTRRKAEMCQGPLCSPVESYRDKLIKEEQQTIS